MVALSKKLRFEVFKRDSFRCGYCGRMPPAVVLEVDHINPRANDGSNDINNLITACFDCNRGKGAALLSSTPPQLAENLDRIREKDLQLKEYNKFVSKIEKRKVSEIEEVAAYYTLLYPKWILTDQFKKTTIARFLELLPKQELIQSWNETYSRSPKDPVRYFCGICWNKINGN